MFSTAMKSGMRLNLDRHGWTVLHNKSQCQPSLGKNGFRDRGKNILGGYPTAVEQKLERWVPKKQKGSDNARFVGFMTP